MRGAEKIYEFIRESRLRWFGDVERTPEKAKQFVVDGSKKRRIKKRSKKVVEKGKTALHGGLAAKTGLPLLAGKTSRVPG